MKQSIGEYRVGITFNPSKMSKVDYVKEKFAELINFMEECKVESSILSPDQEDEPNITYHDEEVLRLLDHSQTLIEDACMNAVKAITKPARLI